MISFGRYVNPEVPLKILLNIIIMEITFNDILKFKLKRCYWNLFNCFSYNRFHFHAVCCDSYFRQDIFHEKR